MAMSPPPILSAAVSAKVLALAVALTGIIATMPYIALQLMGMQVVIAALGIQLCFVPLLGRFVPLLVAFVVLAAYTYTSGLRGTALIAVVKDFLIYATVLAAVIVIPGELGGYAKVFPASIPRFAAGARHAHQSGRRFAYVTPGAGLDPGAVYVSAFGDGIVSSSGRHVVKRNAMILPAYSVALALIALLGFMAVAAGVKAMPAYAPGFASFGNNFAVPALFLHMFPGLVCRPRLCRHRHRRPGARLDHVHRLRQSFHPQYLQGVYRSPTARPAQEARIAKLASLADQNRGAAVCAGTATLLRDPVAIAGRHLDGPDRAGGAARALCAALSHGLLAGWAAGMAAGTWMAWALGFKSSTYVLHAFGVAIPCYAALSALVLNMRWRWCSAWSPMRLGHARGRNGGGGLRLTPTLTMGGPDPPIQRAKR